MTTTHPPRPPAVRPRPVELAVPLAAVAVAALLPFPYVDRLPDPVATHWGFSGLPDGRMPRLVDHVALLAITALVALVPLAAAARADRPSARVLVGLAHGGGAMLALLRWWTLEANDGAASWRGAGPVTLGDVGAGLVLAVPVGLLGWWLARRRPLLPPTARRVDPVVLEPGDAVVWVGRQVAGPALVLPVAAVVLGAVLAAGAPGPVLVVVGPLGAAALALATFARVAVTISERGVDVRLGPLRWPRLRIALPDVTSVAVEEVEPMAFGGWGYRVVPGARAVVVRRGEALRIGRRGRADLVVTVDGAEDAARVLGALTRPR